MPWQHMAKTTT